MRTHANAWHWWHTSSGAPQLVAPRTAACALVPRARPQRLPRAHAMQEGAAQQLHNGNVTCGVELGLLLLEVGREHAAATL